MSRNYKDGRDEGKKTEISVGATDALMIRMTPELKKQLREASKKAKRSMNNYICYLLEQALKPRGKNTSSDNSITEDEEIRD